jgi:hypothetical protein
VIGRAELPSIPKPYEQALQDFLKQAVPGAVLRRPVTYEIPGVWYLHAEVPGSGTTTLRITDTVIQTVPVQHTLETLQLLPARLDPSKGPTVSLTHGPDGLEIHVDLAPS